MRVVSCLLVLVMAGLGWSQTRPVISIPFDGDLNALTAAGTLAGQPDGKPELVPGKFGQALKSGPTTGYSEYSTNLLKSEGGTVEMWVQPLDWTPSQREFHAFFDTRGEGALYLYKYLDGNNLLMLTCANAAGPYASNPFALNWKPGEWHHIAGTWSANGVQAYVDGKPATPMPTAGQLPVKLGPTFRIGDHPWHIERTSSSLIDDVRIYDRALSPAHIAAHAQGNYDFLAPLTAQSGFLKFELDAAKGEVTARYSTGGADVADDAVRVRLAILPKGQPLTNQPEQKLTAGESVAQLALDVSKPGEFDVIAEVRQDGKVAYELRKDLIVPDLTPWRGNKLGLEDKVIPPWTPVEVANGKVSVWDREYDFGIGSQDLIRQISSGGHPLFASPVHVTAPGGVPYTTPLAPFSWNSSATRTTLVRQIVPPGVRMTATTEYDGLVRVELSGGLTLGENQLSIDIPLRPEIAMYRHRYGYDWDTSKITGLLPAGDGVIDHDKFIPYYWLGNNDRGLFWFCESDEMWPNGQSPDAVQIIREAGKVTLRLNLLAKGQKLPDNWKFVFGLQATPVKPLPKDWRKWRFQPGVNGNVNIMWPTPAQDSIKYFGYPEAKDPAVHAARIKALQAAGVKTVPYLCLSFLSAACPEWPFFEKRWAMGPVDSGSSDVAAYGVGFAMVSPMGQDYSDFIVWKTNEFIKQYGIDGLYHDNTHPYGAAELDAGCGYRDAEGKAHPTFPIFGYRDLYRRMYAVLKSQPKETFSMAHMSGKVTIPILAYEDSYLDGEHFRSRVKDSYMDMFGLDTFRAEYMGRQWGIIPYFLPEFDAEHQAQIEPTRGLMALLMLHDTAVWPIWCNVKVANEALAALDAFGVVDADFTGYFDTPAPAATDMKDVYVSAYRKGGRTLLIVGNVSREDRQGQVTLDAGFFKTMPRAAQDWPSKTPLTLTAGKLSLSVPKLGYRLVALE